MDNSHAMPAPADSRYERYVAKADPLLLALALVFLVAWAALITWLEMPRALHQALVTVNAVLWLIFAADLVTRVVLARSSWRYLAKHPLDVLAVLLPPLRPLKVIQIMMSGQRFLTGRGAFKASQALVVSVVRWWSPPRWRYWTLSAKPLAPRSRR